MGERQPSILTNSQREYLKEGGGTGGAARMTRKRIRERVREALFDFPLLVSAFESEGLGRAFEDPDDVGEREHTINVLSSVFAFLYLGLTDTVEPADLAQSAFEDLAADGIRQAYHHRGYSLDSVDVSVNITRGEPLKELKDREDISFAEAFQLLESDEASLEKATEAMLRSLESDRLQEGTDALSTLRNIVPEEDEPIDLDETDEIEFVIKQADEEGKDSE